MVNVLNLNEGINIIHLDIEEDFIISNCNLQFKVGNDIYRGITVVSLRIRIENNTPLFELTGYDKYSIQIFQYILSKDLQYILAIQMENGKYVEFKIEDSEKKKEDILL